MGLSVLVVDDNRELADNLAEALADEGHWVLVAYSGEDALSATGTLRFDIVLSDIRMSGMTGVELIARLGERDPHAIYLLMTAYSSESLLNEAESSDLVRAVLSKSHVLEELVPWLLGAARRAVTLGPREA